MSLFKKETKAGLGCCSLLLSVPLLCSITVAAESRIIKCTDAEGRVIFSQTGCTGGTRERVRIENPRIGWIQSDGSVGTNFKSSPAINHRTDPEVKEPATNDAQRQRCWRAEKKIARIADELRQGYKLKRGRVLYRQREEAEEYLRLFCN